MTDPLRILPHPDMIWEHDAYYHQPCGMPLYREDIIDDNWCPYCAAAIRQPQKFRVYFTNHGYWAERQYASVEAAIAAGKKACFEFSVHRVTADETALVASWSPVGGLRRYGY